MVEELNPNSISGLGRDDPATLAAWAESTQLVDKTVIDVNGQELGRVTRCFAEEGALVRCDVTLSKNAKGIFNAQNDVAGVPATWISQVTDDQVRLRRAAEEILRPEDPRPAHASDDFRGAQGFPRKNR